VSASATRVQAPPLSKAVAALTWPLLAWMAWGSTRPVAAAWSKLALMPDGQARLASAAALAVLSLSSLPMVQPLSEPPREPPRASAPACTPRRCSHSRRPRFSGE